MDEFRLASCFDPAVGMPSLADRSVDHIAVDPPYSETVHTSGNMLRSTSKGHGKKQWGTTEVALDFAAFTTEDVTRCAAEFTRLAKRWILVFTTIEMAGTWSEALTAAGAKRRNTLIWVKRNTTPKLRGDGPANGAEAIVTAWNGPKASTWNAGGAAGIYEVSPAHPIRDGEARYHPTQKPLPLMEQLIVDFTRPGDLILDPYAGSASTLVAAKNLGRHYLGYEISPEYHRAGMGRLENAREQTRMEQIMRLKRRRPSAYEAGPAKAAEQQLDLLGSTKGQG